MSLPLDPGRPLLVRVVAALLADTARRHTEPCDGSNWPLRATCATSGRVTCPLCRRRVTATPAGTGVVRIDPHHRSAGRP